jgi:hypothetical protein
VPMHAMGELERLVESMAERTFDSRHARMLHHSIGDL